MGITLYCKKTGTGLDMGYIGFNRFRNKVAELYSEEFGNHYKELDTVSFVFDSERKAFFETYDKKTEQMIIDKKLNIKVADFCYQSDCSGKIRYGACKVIYNIIKDYDDDICYGYCGRPDCAMFSDLKALIKECYDNKSDLVWY